MRITACAVALLILVVIPVRVHAQGSLAVARDLYASASYDEALTMLNGLASSAKALEERQSIDLYRTLCLVALGRSAEADKAIEAMIAREPLYHPAADELSPRLRSAFADVRKRMLPAIIQKEYADAKAAFDRHDFASAATGFADVLKWIADPDVAALAGAPPLSDLRTLAGGFRDLSVKSIPPPVEAAPPPQPKPLKNLYTAEDRDVVPPVAIRQKVPPYPGNVLRPLSGVVEFIVDEAGIVQSPMMRASINPQFDPVVLSATKNWQYQPATVDGRPVKFLKRLSITVSPTPATQ